MWALRLAKPPLRLAARLRGELGRALAEQRRQGYAQCFEAGHLRRALDGSLRRLGRDRVELFLLHNPPPALVGSEALWRFVDDARRAGDLRSFGISCAGADADIAWLRQPAVEVVEVPLGAGRAATDGFLASAAGRGVGIVARELLGGPGRHDATAIEDALRAALGHQAVSVALLGMTRLEHVNANAALARRLSTDAAVALRA